MELKLLKTQYFSLKEVKTIGDTTHICLMCLPNRHFWKINFNLKEKVT